MVELNKKAFRELRCPKCRALLMLEYIFKGRLSIKCNRCKTVSNFNFNSVKSLLNTVSEEEKKEK